MRRVFDRALGREVVQKLLLWDHLGDEALKRHFAREIRIAAGLHHPWIEIASRLSPWHGKKLPWPTHFLLVCHHPLAQASAVMKHLQENGHEIFTTVMLTPTQVFQWSLVTTPGSREATLIINPAVPKQTNVQATRRTLVWEAKKRATSEVASEVAFESNGRSPLSYIPVVWR